MNREICLSISGHHEESWQPAWGIRTALTALRAFMEGSAKGQLGGMEMGEEERRRLAEGSRTWKCLGCGGGSNEEILKEVEEELEQAGSQGDRKGEVPEGLKLGYREDLVNKDDGEGAKRKSPTETQTDQIQSQPSTNADSSPMSASTNSPLSQPTRTTPILRTTSSSSDALPTWIDKAIVGVVASLAVMIIKKMVV